MGWLRQWNVSGLFTLENARSINASKHVGLYYAWPVAHQPTDLSAGIAAAGGNFDLVARLLGQSLSDRLGQQFVIENRPGASSNLATEAAIRASADGYTLLLAGAVNTINATLLEKLNFDFVRDTAPISGVVQFSNVMTVGPAFPAKTVPEFIAYAEANPDKINHGSSGNGTTQHLAGELFKIMTGISFTHVPYRGASQAIAGLLAGHVQVLFEPLPASMEQIKSGKLQALAVTTAKRSEALPNVPVVSEFVAGYEASGWNGLCAPKNTPVDIVEKLNSAIKASFADPNMKARFADLATIAGSPAAFGELIASETEKWAKVIGAANIKVE